MPVCPAPGTRSKASAPRTSAIRLTLLCALALMGAGGLHGRLAAQESQAPDADGPTGAPVQAAPAPAWRSQLELGFNGAAGNSSFVILRTGFGVTHLRTDVAELELSGLFRYGKNDEVVIARDWRSSLKLDLSPTGKWSPFLFVSASGDAVRRLDLRSEGGAGAKYTVWTSDTGEASISLASLYSFESYKQEAGLAVLPTERAARWSLRTKGERRLGGTTFKNTGFYQPVWDRARDFTLDLTSSATTRLVGNVNLAVEHEYLHDASPPPDIERNDHKLSVVLRIVF